MVWHFTQKPVQPLVGLGRTLDAPRSGTPAPNKSIMTTAGALARTNAQVTSNIPGRMDVPMINVESNLKELWDSSNKTTGGNPVTTDMVADFISCQGFVALNQSNMPAGWSSDMFPNGYTIPSFRIYVVLENGSKPPLLIARSRWVTTGYSKKELNDNVAGLKFVAPFERYSTVQGTSAGQLRMFLELYSQPQQGSVGTMPIMLKNVKVYADMLREDYNKDSSSWAAKYWWVILLIILVVILAIIIFLGMRCTFCNSNGTGNKWLVFGNCESCKKE